MSKFKRSLCRLLIVVLIFAFAPQVHASAYDAHPKLVILLVIDQFRADYLDRYRADFKGRGFRLFLDHGAYFEDCYYDYANTKTAPGHATLATGAYTDGHGISSNEWWDLGRNKQHTVSSVEDERYHLVGMPNGSHAGPGVSPLNLRASTIGDSLRLATQGQSKVFGISLKDRAAILPAGYSANGAYWIDPASGFFITSSYYMSALPDWVNTFNTGGRIDQAEQEAGVSGAKQFFNTVGPTPAANAYELDFARALIQNEQLGRHSVTDLLTISLSANDLLGHAVGPDSPEERQMIDSLDQQLDGFFTWLEKNVPGGLANVWIAFSADHGVAPVASQAAALGMPAAGFDMHKLTASLNDTMNAKFSPGEKVEYLLPQQDLPYLALNEPSFEVAGINEHEAEQAIAQAIPGAVAALAPPAGQIIPANKTVQSPAAAAANPASTPAARPTQLPKAKTNSTSSKAPQTANSAAGPKPAANTAQSSPGEQSAAVEPSAVRLTPTPVVVRTYSREQLASGQFAASEWGLLLAHSYSPNGGWYVMVIPEAFQMPALHAGTTHFSPWSYDRHVPLGFYGTPFTPGIYHGRVQPVDLAATLASLLGVNQPSASIGAVLTQAIHNVPAPAALGSRTRRERRPSEPRTTAPRHSPLEDRHSQ